MPGGDIFFFTIGSVSVSIASRSFAASVPFVSASVGEVLVVVVVVAIVVILLSIVGLFGDAEADVVLVVGGGDAKRDGVNGVNTSVCESCTD